MQHGHEGEGGCDGCDTMRLPGCGVRQPKYGTTVYTREDPRPDLACKHGCPRHRRDLKRPATSLQTCRLWHPSTGYLHVHQVGRHITGTRERAQQGRGAATAPACATRSMRQSSRLGGQATCRGHHRAPTPGGSSIVQPGSSPGCDIGADCVDVCCRRTFAQTDSAANSSSAAGSDSGATGASCRVQGSSSTSRAYCRHRHREAGR